MAVAPPDWERGHVHMGRDVRRHLLVGLAVARLAPVGLDPGDGEQHVGVDAGGLAGLEGDGYQALRRAGQRRADAGRAGAGPGREQRHHEHDQREAAGAGRGRQLHASTPRAGPTAMRSSV